MPKKMWMVRAESKGKLFDIFHEKSLVAIGWNEIGDLTQMKSRKAITDSVQEQWPDLSIRQASTAAGQLYRFVNEIKQGDRIVTYSPSRRVYLVGTLTGAYRYEPQLITDDTSGEAWSHILDVTWDKEVSRDNLAVTTKNSLGAISTLFLLPPEAAADIELALSGKDSLKKEMTEDEDGTEKELLKDLQARALEFIKDRVNLLSWEQMQELVAGLLRAMGYKTRISPGGPDRGKDILASPDGFGFETPRIVVEVKHRSKEQQSAKEIRSFLGGRHQNDKGLFISTGGFSKDAHYEAERASIPLTLMDLEDLVKAIIDHYETMDAQAQRLIPLERIYWPT